MKTFTVVVPDSDAELFAKELTTLTARIIKSEQLDAASEAHRAKRETFMNITEYAPERKQS